jgi:hypothetical protein
MLIRSLQSVVQREQALSKFLPAGTSGLMRRWMSGRLLGMADIYIPYRLYKVNIEDRGLRSARLLAVDALSGNLDPFEFSESPIHNRCADIETRNYLPAQLSESETHVAALAKFRRLVFSAGFFRLAKPVISVELIESDLFIPYWAGFYGEEKSVRVLMLDAIRGTIEGGKITNSVKAWLHDAMAAPLSRGAPDSFHFQFHPEV